jgi:poly(3-hydroxybutyrate) depolymerase
MIQHLRPLVAVAMLAVTVVLRAGAQAPISVLTLSVRHTTLKNTIRPTGELKAIVDSLDTQIGAAARLGRTSDLRRLYAHAATVLARRPWTPEAEFASSLVSRTDRQVVDPARRWSMRVEQIYAPAIVLARPLVARATLRQRIAGSAPTAPMSVVKALGTFDGVPRDLRDTPFTIEVDLHDVADGPYVVAVELLDSARTLGTATLAIVIRAGLDASVARLEAAAAKAQEPVRSDLIFPVDRLRKVNLSRIALATFNPARDFAAAESLLVATAARKDPWAGRTGDLKRHYLLDAADEVMPYRLYVPKGYRPSKPLPLIIALHGLGATEDSFFDQYGSRLPALAEERGYIVAAPLGYRVDGGYGVSLGGPTGDPAAARLRALSEEDVMQVLHAVRSRYTVDDQRVYLMGHSMGAIGTWAIAAKTPNLWAALGVFSGFGVASNARVIGGIPQFVVHGDADPTVAVGGSRVMVAALKGVGADVQYVEVPGGDHVNVVEPNFSAMFDFFDSHTKRPVAQP